jgi:hypothetical protein
MRAATQVEEELMAANANTGGDSQDEKRSEEVRNFNNEQYSSSVNASLEAREDADKKQDVVDSIKSNLRTVDHERLMLNEELGEADHKMAGATYEIEAMDKSVRHAEERVAQEEAIAGVAKKQAEVARKEAQAAKVDTGQDRAFIKPTLIFVVFRTI